jgi:hypothetical protein
MELVEEHSGKQFRHVDFAVPEVWKRHRDATV